jgi:lipopolysaccharide/colanic/teichoic acid biosynthesis glycosyltransferase
LFIPIQLHPHRRENGDFRQEDYLVASREYSQIISQPLISQPPRRELPIRKSAAHVLRRAFDAVCALAGLAILIPIFAMIALAIKLDDGGPVLYFQTRVGMRLRKFRLLKFRSMFSDSAGGSLLTAPNDARVTRVGRFLRKFKLDELPQLVNVLKGEMQLVGVRPQVESFVDMFRDEYETLLQSPPGITDPASLSFRNEEQFFQESSNENQYVANILPFKLEMSLEYSRTRTFFSDIEILFRTVLGLPSPSAVWENNPCDPAVHSLSEFVFRNHESEFPHEPARKFRRAARSSTPQPGFSALVVFQFSPMESDPFHQNDELDKIPDLP